MDIGMGDYFGGRNRLQKKPWMDKKKFVLGTVENLASIIDACIVSGRYAIDLETSGTDNRVQVTPGGHYTTYDQIAGVGLCPDGETGYYIPLRHAKVKLDGNRDFYECNIPIQVFAQEFLRLAEGTDKGKTVAIFHNGKFDQEFLQFNGTGVPWGEWDKQATWDDTMILCYLRNARARNKKLKDLSAADPDMPKELWPNSQCGGPGLGMEMLHLYELFGHDKEQKNFIYDFTTLDPTEESTLWYACGDVICTYLLYPVLSPHVLQPDSDGATQKAVYAIEKGAVAGCRWMERNRIHVDLKRVSELIVLGHKEWYASIMEVYETATKILGRDVMPGMYKVLQDIFVADDPTRLLDDQLAEAERKAKGVYPDKGVTLLGRDNKKWPSVYDVCSPQQLGTMFDEMDVPNLKHTEKSNQVKTSKDELDRVIEEAGAQFPFMNKIKRFREVNKALSTYLYPMIWDIKASGGNDPTGGLMRISFNGHKVDTGRYATSAKEGRSRLRGWPQVNFQAIPSTAYDPKNPRPECMRRIREVVTARPVEAGKPIKFIAAFDFAGEELRLVTNLSREVKWLTEFFRCSGCGRTFSQEPRPGNGTMTPAPPPPRCPNCGSDKIGDLHTLTAMEVYGTDAPSRPDWKVLRGHAKGVNFGLCYGGGGQAVVRATGCDKNEGWRIKNQFDKTYSGLHAWWDKMHQFARKHGFVRTAFGRRYPLPDINSQDDFFKSKAERNAVNGPIQGCLHPDSRIPTDIGTLRIEDLVGKRFKVWTGVGWAGGRSFPSGLKDLVYTTLSSGGVLRTSPDHRFRVYDPQDQANPLVWVRQEDLTPNMWVLVDAKGADTKEVILDFEDQVKTSPNKKGFSFNGNCEAIWEILGLVIGDGSITDDGLTIHVGGPDAEAQAQFYADRFNATLPGLGITLRKQERGPAEPNKLPMWQVHMYNRAFLGFCRTLGMCDWNTYTKRIPEAVWHQSVAHRAAFLRGYFSADGCVNVAQAVDVRSVNQVLLQDIYVLLRSIGLRCVARLGSQRVGVKDIVGFQQKVGFLTPKKQDRLDAVPINPWSGQWHPLPHDLISRIGVLVYQSAIYDGLPGWQKSAVLRLCLGSGSKPQCLRYLDKMPVDEVPADLRLLLQYDYEQVVSSDHTGQQVEMYDIEVFDDEHAFVCDGVIVHNSGADIIKIAMALIYKEMKKRSWLDKVMMIASMHDELVFEIDADVIEEALPLLVNLMANNTAILAKNWIIPLTCDVEVGFDWTVSWDINGMTFKESRFLPGNKKVKEPGKPKIEDFKGDTARYQEALVAFPAKLADWGTLPSWPEVLVPWFRAARGEDSPILTMVDPQMVLVSRAAESGTTVSPDPTTVATLTVQTEAVVVASDSLPDITVSPAMVLNRIHFGDAPAVSGPWEFRLAAPLTAETVVYLARTIVECKDGGMSPLKIITSDGVSLDLDAAFAEQGIKGPWRVSPVEFKAQAKVYRL